VRRPVAGRPRPCVVVARIATTRVGGHRDRHDERRPERRDAQCTGASHLGAHHVPAAGVLGSGRDRPVRASMTPRQVSSGTPLRARAGLLRERKRGGVEAPRDQRLRQIALAQHPSHSPAVTVTSSERRRRGGRAPIGEPTPRSSEVRGWDGDDAVDVTRRTSTSSPTPAPTPMEA